MFDDLVPSPAATSSGSRSSGLLASAANVARGAAEAAGDIAAGVGDATIAFAEGAGANPANGFLANLRRGTEKARNADFGYEEATSWDDVKAAPLRNFVPYALEQGLISLPDMAAAVVALPAYAYSRAGSLADERAGNNGFENATVGDLVKVLPAAVGSTLLERFGARGAFGLDDAAKPALATLPDAVGRAAVREGATEAGQAQIDYAATNAGTDAGWDAAEAGERSLQGAVAGAGFGGAARAAVGAGQIAGSRVGLFDDLIGDQQGAGPEAAAMPPVAEGEAPAPVAVAAPGEPVTRLAGDEVGMTFRGPEDMPALRTAARQWYDANLRGTEATTRDGITVGFNRRGRDKSTYGGKGDVLLRSVPAIRAIIENGEIVHREPGNRPGVAERMVIAAPVDFLGDVRSLAVSVHKTPDGQFQYDFTFDRERDGAGGSRITRDDGLKGAPGSLDAPSSEVDARPGFNPGGPSIEDGRLPSLEVPLQRANEINLFEWPEPFKKVPPAAPARQRLSEAEQKSVVDIVRRVSGLSEPQFMETIRIPTTADGLKAWGRDGRDGESIGVAGFYDVSRDAITIALDIGRDGPRVAHHEAFHRLQRLFLNEQERDLLAGETETLRAFVASDPARAEQAAGMAPIEIEAEAFALYSERMDRGEKAPIRLKGRIRAAWDRIRATTRRVRNYLGKRGYATYEDVFEPARTGETARRQSAATAPTKAKEDWSLFPARSGTMGVPRTQMPQVKAEHRGALANFVTARGIGHSEATVPADILKATQAEFSPERVKAAKERTGGDRAVLVSVDWRVVDGHHQWLAAREDGREIRVIRFDAPIGELLEVMREFPSSTQEVNQAPMSKLAALRERARTKRTREINAQP